MSEVIGTIDMTPTRAEHARILSYIMSSHLRGKSYSFGDYWNYTPVEENAIFATWQALDSLNDVYKEAGLDWFRDVPESHRAKVIMTVHKVKRLEYQLAEVTA